MKTLFLIVMIPATYVLMSMGDLNHANVMTELRCEKILNGEWPNTRNIDCSSVKAPIEDKGE